VKFYLWLILQNKNWTADMLRSRGWPHDDCCSLRDQELETAPHLALCCSYTKEVCSNFQNSHLRVAQVASRSSSISRWWTKVRRGKMHEQRKRRSRWQPM
jgi:hypothetical protein